MDYSDTLVTLGTHNTGPRQVKEKKTQQTQKKTQQYRKLNKLSTRTQPTIGGRHLVVSK